jgi:uncharacterized protein with von Willebrand factor type A (vWA) domain
MFLQQHKTTRVAALTLAWLLIAGGAWSSSLGQSPAARGIRGTSATNNDYVRVKVFGIEGTGNKFVYLFDRSGSMDGAPLAAAKKQLLDSLQSLGDTQQFDIVFFNHRLQIFDSSGGYKRTTFATDRNKELAARFVNGVKADGGTDRLAALRHALALRPNVIFFLSDAEKPMSTKDLDAIARLNERVGAQICAIEFGRGDQPPTASSLAELAHANNGQYVYIDTKKLPK